MNELIFGYKWEEIQSMQQGTYTRPTITPAPAPDATQADYDLLVKHGIEGLKRMEFFGVLDRLAID